MILSDKNKLKGMVIGVDISSTAPIDGAILLDQSDFTKASTQEKILEHLSGRKVRFFI